MAVIEALAGDGTVLIEVRPAYGSEQTSIGDRLTARTDQAIQRARSTVTRLATEMAEAVREMPESSRPESFSVEFGISFTMEGDAMVARAGAEASLHLTLTFSARDSDTAIPGQS